MSLLALQTCLARLYLEPQFREAFFRARDTALDASDLTAEERGCLARLDRGQVERFARSLRNKRLGALRGRLPALVHAAGDRFPGWFQTYCDGHPSAPEGRADALAFIGFLTQRLPSDASLHRPAYLPDLVRLERHRLELLEAARCVPAHEDAEREVAGSSDEGPAPERPRWDESASLLNPSECRPAPTRNTSTHGLLPEARPALTSIALLMVAHFDFERLFPRLVEGHAACPTPQPSWLLLAVVDGTVRMKRLTESTTRLLRRCDGSRTLAEILAEFPIAAPDRCRFEAECVRFLEELRQQGLLLLRFAPP